MKAVIFDMDGVLIDTEPISKKGFETAFLHTQQSFTEALYQQILGRSLKDIEAFLADSFKNPQLASEIIAKRNQFFTSYYQEHAVTIKAGIPNFLTFLQQRGFKIGLSTSAPREVASDLLTRAELFDFFEAATYGNQVAYSKPHPEIFLRTAQQLEIAPEQAYVIEDSEAGVKAALDGGFKPVYIPEANIVPDEYDCLQFEDIGQFHTQLIGEFFEESQRS